MSRDDFTASVRDALASIRELEQIALESNMDVELRQKLIHVDKGLQSVINHSVRYAVADLMEDGDKHA